MERIYRMRIQDLNTDTFNNIHDHTTHPMVGGKNAQIQVNIRRG